MGLFDGEYVKGGMWGEGSVRVSNGVTGGCFWVVIGGVGSGLRGPMHGRVTQGLG